MKKYLGDVMQYNILKDGLIDTGLAHPSGKYAEYEVRRAMSLEVGDVCMNCAGCHMNVEEKQHALETVYRMSCVNQCNLINIPFDEISEDDGMVINQFVVRIPTGATDEVMQIALAEAIRLPEFSDAWIRMTKKESYLMMDKELLSKWLYIPGTKISTAEYLHRALDFDFIRRDSTVSGWDMRSPRANIAAKERDVAAITGLSLKTLQAIEEKELLKLEAYMEEKEKEDYRDENALFS